MPKIHFNFFFDILKPACHWLILSILIIIINIYQSNENQYILYAIALLACDYQIKILALSHHAKRVDKSKSLTFVVNLSSSEQDNVV